MKKILLSLISVALIASVACKQENQFKTPEWEFPSQEQKDTTTTTEPEPVDTTATPEPPAPAVVWHNITADYKDLPEYIEVFRADTLLGNIPAIAYLAVADMSKAKFGLWSINDPQNQGTSDALRTPSTQYGKTPAPIMINAGYFYSSGGKNYSSSLAIADGKMYAHNITYASEDWVTIYYPTRAAMLQEEDGTWEACWTYYTNNGKHYKYSEPSPNSWDESPQQTPSASFPVKGVEITEKFGIGGGPLLIRGGEFYNSIAPELFESITPYDRHPRTGIGYGDGKLYFFVCEGRQMTKGIAGLTTEEEGRVFEELGCTEAMNLDGGGSTCMLICGQETIKPSDGNQRKVGSIIYLQ